MPFGIGPVELVVLLVLGLLLFGAGRIPKIASGLGRGIRNFRGEVLREDEEWERPVLPPGPLP